MTKHSDMRHHFLREHTKKENICLEYISTENQMANILTKPLDSKAFCKIQRNMGSCDINDLK